MEENSQKNVVNHFEAGSNCQVFNGNITGCTFAMPGSSVTQQAAVPATMQTVTQQGAAAATMEGDEQPERPCEEERNEERFHFVHPEIEDGEAWRIHDSVKRLVTYQKVPEICAYLKEQKQKGKIMLPQISTVMYSELVRLGMPTSDGYTEKHFKNYYMK